MATVSKMRRMLGGISTLATLALVATLLTGINLTPANAGPGYQKPKVGQCRNLTGAQARAKTNSTKPISCASTHTAQTVGVGKLSAKLAKSSKKKIKAAEASKCQKLFNKYVGRSAATRAKSAFALRIFNPTKAQKKKGARWFRCDAVLPRGSSLTAIKTSEKPLLSSPTPASQALCQTSGGSSTTCDATHSFKATNAFKLTGKKYPGKKKAKAAAKKGCNTRITGAFRYDAPTASEWAVGKKYAVCFDGHTLPAKETVKPQTTLVVPQANVTAGNAVTATGVATDNVAVGSLSATIRNGTGAYLQDNGTLAATANTYPYEVTAGDLGTKSMSWGMDLTDGLPANTYTVAVTVKDINGNSTTVSDSFTVVGQDNTDPIVSITSPTSSMGVGEALTITGTATDAGLIESVEVRFRRVSNNTYMRNNGEFEGGANPPLTATVNGLNTGNATFAFGSATFVPDVDPGTYQVIVEATDASPNANVETVTKNVTVTATQTSQEVIYQMNEPAQATQMNDTGGNGLHGDIDPAADSNGLTSNVAFGGAVGYQWAQRPGGPEALPVQNERVIQVDDDPLLDPGTDVFTIEIRYRTSNSYGNIIQKGQSGGAQWKIQAPGGRPSCLFKSSAGTDEQASVRAEDDLSDNQWHTLKCQLDENYVTMWVDGVQEPFRKRADVVGSVSNNNVMSIGGKTNCNQDDITCDYFSGQIDWVKITKT